VAGACEAWGPRTTNSSILSWWRRLSSAAARYDDPLLPADFPEDSTTRVAADRRGLRVPAVDLVVVAGPSRGLRLTLSGGAATVGSAQGNPLCIQDPQVSRLHCELRVRPGAVTLRDRGSTNGTFVDGVRVRDADLPAGALVHVGASAFRVEVHDEPAFVDISDRTELGELVGGSVEMRRVYAAIERVAPGDTTVLLQGETGTGKEVVARTVHALSKRSAGPFVPVDCGSIPATLFESELFGHTRGAFSGAVSDRRGVFEEASGGTLFLDEIGELPLALQPKLLRALETRSVRPVGSNALRPVDARIVAATNRPLAQAVNEGLFRDDLYYRLAVVDVTLPPLRSRREDIAPLAASFYARLRGPNAVMPADFAATLARREWPGNVRELRNFVERAVALGLVDADIRRSSRPPPPNAQAAAAASNDVAELVPLDRPLKDARQLWTMSFEGVYVRHVLRRAQGNVTRAAELAGVSRRFLQRMLARLGIAASDVEEKDD
jgi:DNA-binding NtrC family response regulator